MNTISMMRAASLALAALCSASAMAYDSATYNSIMWTGTHTINSGIIQSRMARDRLRDSAGASATSKRSSSSLAASSGSDFQYRPSSAISRQMEADILAIWNRSSPQLAQTAQQSFARQNAIAKFDDNVNAYGLRSGDVGDAMTAYWVIMWVAANQQPLPNKRQVSAVREQLQAQLAQNREVVGADDARRQQIAETFIYEFLLMNTLRLDASNASERRQLSASATQQMSKFGLDVRNMRLTDSGFVAG